MIDEKYNYYAFVSYRSSDEKWAKWVQQQIESYRLPAVLQQKRGDLPKGQIRPLFRYHTDIQPNELKAELQNKLEQSKYLLVICSPRSAQSQWVGAEIEGFIKMGRRDRIIPIIVDGRPYSGDPETECFHPVLQQYFPHSDILEEDHEILGVNLNEEGSGSKYMKRQRAIMQVVSRMLDVNYDQLWQRRRRQLIRRWVMSIIGAVMVIGAVVGAAWMNLPKDVQVTIEPTEQVANLPEDWQAEVVLHLDKEDVALNLSHQQPDGFFYDIPAALMGEKVGLTMTARDYQRLDTTVVLSTTLHLPLRRDPNRYGHLMATVVRDGMPLKGVTLAIAGQTVTTDSNGRIELHVPLTEQRVAYPIQTNLHLEWDTLYAPCGQGDVIIVE